MVRGIVRLAGDTERVRGTAQVLHGLVQGVLLAGRDDDPGAVGNEASTQQESFTLGKATEGNSSTCVSGGLLDYPHYTRPADFRGMPVPEVLFSGNHEEIRRWRRRTALEKTLRNRPDLLDGVDLNLEDKKFVAQMERAEEDNREGREH